MEGMAWKTCFHLDSGKEARTWKRLRKSEWDLDSEPAPWTQGRSLDPSMVDFGPNPAPLLPPESRLELLCLFGLSSQVDGILS